MKYPTKYIRSIVKNINKEIKIINSLEKSCGDYQDLQKGAILDRKTFHILAAVNTALYSIPVLRRLKQKEIVRLNRKLK